LRIGEDLGGDFGYGGALLATGDVPCLVRLLSGGYRPDG